jgi:DNA polymerase III epsilon subunit-like protein
VSTPPERRELRALDLCFLDVETTGPLFGFHEIIEIGAIRTPPGALIEKGRWSKRIRPFHPERLTPAASAVNGYRPEEWVSADESSKDVWTEFTEFVDGCVPVCHNPSFDRAFITLAAAATGVVDLKLDYHWIGTETLAWPLYVRGTIAVMSLDGLCAFVGVPPEPRPHTALAGAEACRRVYAVLLKSRFELYA